MHASPPKVATPSRKVSRVHPAVSPRVSLVIPRHPAVSLNTPITSCSDLARSTSPTEDAVQDLAHDVVARSRQKDREAHLVKGRSTSLNGAAAERRCSGEAKEVGRLSGEALMHGCRLALWRALEQQKRVEPRHHYQARAVPRTLIGGQTW